MSNKLKQGNELKAVLQSRREWRSRDLISKIWYSFLSKHLTFRSCQRHHETQCGIVLYKAIFWCLPKGPCQAENKLVTLCDITHRRPNKFHTIVRNSKARGQWRRRWFTDSLTPFAHVAPIHNSSTSIP